MINRPSLLHILTVTLTLCLLIPIQTVLGQQSLFDEANELMEDLRYIEAMETYRAIEKQGYSSGPLFYNMGIASLYQDSLGLAKSYFLESATYPDTRQEAEQALRLLEQRFERRAAVLPKLPWERLFEQLSDTFGAFGVMVISLLLIYMAAGIRIAIWIVDRNSLLFRVSSWTALILATLLFASSIYIERLEKRYTTGVVTESRSTVYQQPDQNSSPISNVYEGYTMRVDRDRTADTGEWLYVRLENGMTGWIRHEPVRLF